MKSLEIISLSDRKQLIEFIRLPFRLHQHHTGWVPALYRDERHYFNPKKNLAFRYCDTTLALAFVDGRPAGRIMGVINNRYNQARNVRTARFCLFECTDDPELSHLLIHHVEEWARRKDMTEIIGPFGMYYHDPMGFIVEGMEHIPAVATYYNFGYIPGLVEREGFTSFKELWVYRIDVPDELPALYRRILSKIESNANLKRINFSRRRQLKQYILPVLRLLNESFEDIYGYSVLDEEEMRILARQYMSFLDPSLVKVVEYQGEVAGFFIAMPNISRGLIASGGHLFPFGFLKILLAAKKSRQLDFLLGGIRKQYQGIGIDVLLGGDMLTTARAKHFSMIDSHLELETNFKIHAEMEKVGGKKYKNYRIYRKVI